MARIFKLGTTTCSLQTTASTAALYSAGPCHDLAGCFGCSSPACCDGVEISSQREINLRSENKSGVLCILAGSVSLKSIMFFMSHSEFLLLLGLALNYPLEPRRSTIRSLFNLGRFEKKKRKKRIKVK